MKKFGFISLLLTVLLVFMSCSVNAAEQEIEEAEKTSLNDVATNKEITTGELIEMSTEEEIEEESRYHVSWDLEEDELRIIAQYAQSFPVSPYWQYCSNIEEVYTEDNTLIVNISTVPNTLIPTNYPCKLRTVYAFNGDDRIQQHAFSIGVYDNRGVYYNIFSIPDYWKDATKYFIVAEIEEHSIRRICYIKIVRD